MELIFGFLLTAIGVMVIMAIVIESIETYYDMKERVSDSKRFLDKDKAIEHEKLYQRHEEELDKLREAWSNE